jgi:hypothetical protein
MHNMTELLARAHNDIVGLDAVLEGGWARNEGASEAQIIGKPFVDSELHEKVRTALARRPPGKVVRPQSC